MIAKIIRVNQWIFVMHILYFGAALLCWLHLIAGEDAINADIVNSRVQRTVDLTTHLPKVNSRITVENAGKTVVRYYIVAIDPNLASNVSFVGASVSHCVNPLCRSNDTIAILK